MGYNYIITGITNVKVRHQCCVLLCIVIGVEIFILSRRDSIKGKQTKNTKD